MSRRMLIFALAIPLVATGQEPERPKWFIHIYAPSGWMLSVNSDGSGRLQYGAGAFDGWKFPAGTIDVARAEKELRSLPADPKGGLATQFVFSFEAERTAPDKPGPGRYTRDEKIIPALFKSAVESAPTRSEIDARRRAELLKRHPPGELPSSSRAN